MAVFSEIFIYCQSPPESNRRSLMVDATHNSNSRRNTPRQAPIGRLGRLCQNDNGLTCICIPQLSPYRRRPQLTPLATVCLIRLKVRLTFSMGESGASFRGNIAFASRYIRFCELFIKSSTSSCHCYAYMYSPSRTGERGSFSRIVQ